MDNGDKPAFISDNPVYNCNGLTKREYIATACLQGLLSDTKNGVATVNQGTQLNVLAVAFADELLEELEKPDARNK